MVGGERSGPPPLELIERGDAAWTSPRYCCGCGALWAATLGELLEEGWRGRWCWTCGAWQPHHRTPPGIWQSGRCDCPECRIDRAFAAAQAHVAAPRRRMVPRPAEDPLAKKFPWIDEAELAAQPVAA